jgi:hypothetical protein
VQPIDRLCEDALIIQDVFPGVAPPPI